MRLIDIEEEVCADCVCRDKCDRQAYCWAKEMKTVDAVPVVRCKDCIKISTSVTEIKNAVWCRKFRAYMPCDGFCYYGERKEGVD